MLSVVSAGARPIGIGNTQRSLALGQHIPVHIQAMGRGTQGLHHELQAIFGQEQLLTGLARLCRGTAGVDRIQDRVHSQDQRLSTNRTKELTGLHHAATGGGLPSATHLTRSALIHPNATNLGLDEVRPRSFLGIPVVGHVLPAPGSSALMRLGGILITKTTKRVTELVHSSLDALAAYGRYSTAPRAQDSIAHKDDSLAIMLRKLAQHIPSGLGVDAHMTSIGTQSAAVEGGVIVTAKTIHSVVSANQVRAQEIEIGAVRSKQTIAGEEPRHVFSEFDEAFHLAYLIPLAHEHHINAVGRVAVVQNPVPTQESAGLAALCGDTTGGGVRMGPGEASVGDLRRLELQLACLALSLGQGLVGSVRPGENQGHENQDRMHQSKQMAVGSAPERV